jgi:aryl-alcohol dehydrogenase-like predicted oxidoreductase
VGKALKGVPRHELFLATKCFFPMSDLPNDRGLSRKHIVESCRASLRRLGTDYVDLYQCHRYDPAAPLDETLRALEDLVRWGDALYVGVSEWTAAQITDGVRRQEARGFDRFVSNQPQYSLLRRQVEKEVLPRCAAEGLGLVVFSPLAQGVLTGKYKPGAKPPAGTRAYDEKGGGAHFIQGLLKDGELLKRVQKLAPLAA